MKLNLSLRPKVLSLAVLGFIAAMVHWPSSHGAEKEKSVMVDYDQIDWREVLPLYEMLTGRKVQYAADLPKEFLDGKPPLVTNLHFERPKSEATTFLEKALGEQLGILLIQNPDGKTFTASYRIGLHKQTISGDQASRVVFTNADWRDTLSTYTQLTGLKIVFADNFPKELKAPVSFVSEGKKLAATVAYENALREQCGVFLSPNSETNTVTITYLGEPKPRPAKNPAPPKK